jgi:EAL domain-containing protein (putative c-di-GMP-specific phosphodiesterase class I)
VFPEDGLTFADLLSHADLAMFEAKAQRSSAVEAFKPILATRAHAQMVVATELHQAIDRGEIEPFYQPIVVLANGEWRGLEALARWRHPKRGLLLPSEFIAAAEEQGLIGEIGRVMAQASVAHLAQWREQFACTLRLTVNVSAQELRSVDYVPRMLALIAQHNLPNRAIALEVTEGSVVLTEPSVRERFAALRKGGVMIALDDLGIGYSTFEYFKRFPVDFVKIDKLFMEGVPTRRVDAAIVRSMATLGRELGLLLVAEGIERPEQAEFALQAGCDFGQGYFYTKPKSAAEIEALFQTGKIRLPALRPA